MTGRVSRMAAQAMMQAVVMAENAVVGGLLLLSPTPPV